jgi:hypothetical protein
VKVGATCPTAGIESSAAWTVVNATATARTATRIRRRDILTGNLQTVGW